MNYGIFNHLCAAPNPSVSIASIMDCCINYNGINQWKSIWVSVQSHCISARVEFKLHIWIKHCSSKLLTWRQYKWYQITKPCQIGSQIGQIWYQGALDVKYSIIWGARSGWVGWGHFAKVSDQNCQKSQELLLVVAGWVTNDVQWKVLQILSAILTNHKGRQILFSVRWSKQRFKRRN